VFGEQERQIIRSRVLAGLDRVRQQGKKLGRPKVPPKVEAAIREHLSAGNGILKVAAMVGVGSGTVQRVKREMTVVLAEARLSGRNQRFAGQVLVTAP
jgi:DNA invertase Pin-like site-specific DNA recombinase